MTIKQFRINHLKIFLFILVVLSISYSAVVSNNVNCIQYYCKKSSTLNKETIHSEYMFYLKGNSVKVSYFLPHKKTFILHNGIIKVQDFDNPKQNTQYPIEQAPLILKNIFIPTIFNAAQFLNKTMQDYQVDQQKQIDQDTVLISAIPQKQNLIKKIEYLYNPKTYAVSNYKIINNDAISAEVKFSDYKTFANNFILPTKIETVIVGKQAIIRENENFTRIKVNQPIEDFIFEN